MKEVLWVAAGGALGASARFKLGGLVLHHAVQWKFPFSTFAVNVLGCLLAGVLAGLVVRHDAFSSDVRLFLFTGVLGGFTTFSAFGLETVFLLQRHEIATALANVALSTIVGILVLWLGLKALA